MVNKSRTLGQHIRQRRWDELRVRQRDLAAAAGLSAGYLSQLEHDKARATEPTLRRLARALDLDEFALVEQAIAEHRTASRFGSRAKRTTEAPPDPLPVVAPAPLRPDPARAWLTTAEAAAVMGLTRGYVDDLAKNGALAPAYRTQLPGVKGPKRWLIAASAVMAFHSLQSDYRHRQPESSPEGLVSMQDFQAASGLSYGALHRRLEANQIASIRIGRRRFIPETELERFLERRRDEGG